MDFLEIIKIVGIVINILFILILLLVAGLGFLSGLWKKLRTLGGVLIAVIFLLIFLTPISKALVDMNIPGVGSSINELIIDGVSDKLANGNDLVGEELILLCETIALSIIKMIALPFVMGIMLLIIEPLNALILKIVVGKEKRKKTLGIRFGGMGIGIAEVLIVYFFMLLPLYGTSSLIMSYENVLTGTEEMEEIVEAVDIIDDTIPNAINKIFGKKMPYKALGSITAAKNKNGKLNIFKEIDNARPIVEVVIEANGCYEGDYFKASVANREELVKFIEQTNILEVFGPAAIEIFEASDVAPGVDFDEIKKIDFAEDKKHIAEIVNVLLDFAEELDLSDPKKLLANKKLPQALKDLGTSLEETSFRDLLLSIVQNKLSEALEGNETLNELSPIIDITKIEKEDLADDLYKIGIILNTIADLNFFEGEENLLDKPEALETLIDNVFEISLIKGNEKEIVDVLLNVSELEIDFSDFDFNKIVSWKNEAHAILDLMVALKEDSNVVEMSKEKIENIILMAVGSDDEPCYIASYILGIVINSSLEEFLGEDVYAEFHANHDFTNPMVLKASVKDIVSIISLAKPFMETPEVKEWTKEEVKDFCDSFADIDVKTEEVTVSLIQKIAKDVEVEITKEEIENADIEKESILLEEILTAIQEEKSDEEIDKLVEKAEEETVIIAAVIDKFFR